MDRDFNIHELSDDVENVINNTNNMVTINSILNAIEDAIKKDKDVTDDFTILLPSYEQSIIISLRIEDSKDILKSLFNTCVKLEEYEMCIRIKKLDENDV